jgi:hypothetical protein
MTDDGDGLPRTNGNIVRILPGFTITREQVDKCLQIMEEALAETTRMLNPKSVSGAWPVAVSVPGH